MLRRFGDSPTACIADSARSGSGGVSVRLFGHHLLHHRGVVGKRQSAHLT